MERLNMMTDANQDDKIKRERNQIDDDKPNQVLEHKK